MPNEFLVKLKLSTDADVSEEDVADYIEETWRRGDQIDSTVTVEEAIQVRDNS